MTSAITQSGRRGGKSAAQRKMLLDALADGLEVYVAGRDGLWRVTATGIGPLWEKIGQPCPDRRPIQSRGLYEQVVQGKKAAKEGNRWR
jgi:hypothetical protein